MQIATQALPGVAVRASKSSPAMPDPDPQPPKPRAVSPARWLLMLLPSVPMILAPQIAKAWTGSHDPKATGHMLEKVLGIFVLHFAIATTLSLGMGLLLEKWRYGAIKNVSRGIGSGFTILFTNCFIAFAGCNVIPRL